MRDADERQQVVLAHRPHRDGPGQHELVVRPRRWGTSSGRTSRGVSSSAYARAIRPGVPRRLSSSVETPRASSRSAAARSAAARSTVAAGGTTRRGVTVMVSTPSFSPTIIGFIMLGVKSRGRTLMDRQAVAAIAALDDDVRRALYEHVRSVGAPVTRRTRRPRSASPPGSRRSTSTSSWSSACSAPGPTAPPSGASGGPRRSTGRSRRTSVCGCPRATRSCSPRSWSRR